MTSCRRFSLALFGLILLAGCHNTAQGVKADTKRAVEKTGHAVEKTGEKIEGKGDKSNDPPPSNEPPKK
jgi:predicted small secreted protein